MKDALLNMTSHDFWTIAPLVLHFSISKIEKLQLGQINVSSERSKHRYVAMQIDSYLILKPSFIK